MGYYDDSSVQKGEDEDPESYLTNYKKTCISTGSRTTKNWVTFILEFPRKKSLSMVKETIGGYQSIFRILKWEWKGNGTTFDANDATEHSSSSTANTL